MYITMSNRFGVAEICFDKDDAFKRARGTNMHVYATSCEFNWRSPRVRHNTRDACQARYLRHLTNVHNKSITQSSMCHGMGTKKPKDK